MILAELQTLCIHFLLPLQLWHLYSSLLGLGWTYQFSITDHGNLLHRYENGPPAASRILQRHSCPAALHSDVNGRQACRFKEGEGNQGKCN